MKEKLILALDEISEKHISSLGRLLERSPSLDKQVD